MQQGHPTYYPDQPSCCQASLHYATALFDAFLPRHARARLARGSHVRQVRACP